MVALAYLIFKCVQIASSPGYDFKFLWLAGRLWIDGVSPYGPAYEATGAGLITEGHVPQIWAYPPNWWALCLGLALLPVKAASVVWSLINVALAAGASALLAAAFRRAYPQVMGDLAGRMAFLTLMSAHLFLIAVLEATAISLSTGQTAILMYFGVALLLFAMTRPSRVLGVVGLTIIFLKPHVGLPFAAVLFLIGKEQRLQVLAAGALSALLALPAFIVDSGVIGDFLAQVSAYDAAGNANLPQAMTGVRRLLWQVGGQDFPGIAAALAATGLCVLLTAKPVGLVDRTSPAVAAWQTLCLVCVVVVAVAPLHYYDFVLIGAPALILMVLPRAWAIAGIVGLILMLRPNLLGVRLGLYDPAVPIYEGSLVATIGALLLMAAVAGGLRQWRRHAAVARLTA